MCERERECGLNFRFLCLEGCAHPLHRSEREGGREREGGTERKREREREREKEKEKEKEIEKEIIVF